MEFLISILLSLFSTQPADTTNARDNEIIDQYVFQLNCDLAGLDPDSILLQYSQEEIDHILDTSLYSLRANFSYEKVHYSPDSSFKIFIIEGEFCGAYCHNDWVSFTHFF